MSVCPPCFPFGLYLRRFSEFPFFAIVLIIVFARFFPLFASFDDSDDKQRQTA